MKRISVIIPVYNVQPYLEKCVRSVISQTYRELEILLVDDGSTDDSGEICDDLAGEDGRIRVIHSANHAGRSEARNAGLDASSGDLIAFVDSDDWVSEAWLDTMFRTMRDTYADIVECDVISSAGRLRMPDPSRTPQTYAYRPEEALKLLFLGQVFRFPVWNKLYKKSVVANLRFDPRDMDNGEFWTCQAFGNCGNIAKVDTPLYYSYLRREKNTAPGYEITWTGIIESKMKCQKYIDLRYPELINHSLTNLTGTLITAGQIVLLNAPKEHRKEEMEILEGMYQKATENRRITYLVPSEQKKWYKMAEASFPRACKMKNLLGDKPKL